jgi:hypothetical protein
MKAGDLCPLWKKGHLRPTDTEFKLACNNSECNWVETDDIFYVKKRLRTISKKQSILSKIYA